MRHMAAIVLSVLAIFPCRFTSAQPIPAQVGRFGELERIEFRGAKTFTAENITRSVGITTDFLIKAHPLAPLKPFVDHVRDSVRLGYMRAGFRQVQVRAEPDRNRRVLVVEINEGQRSTAGSIHVTGNTGVSTAAILEALSEPQLAPEQPQPQQLSPPEAGKLLDKAAAALSGKPTIKPFWKIGGPAKADHLVEQEAGKLVQRVYGRAGYRHARVEVLLRRRESGVLGLDVHVLQEGAPVRVGPITFSGKFTDDKAQLLGLLKLKSGIVADADLPAETKKRLDKLGRYYKSTVQFVPADKPDVLGLNIDLQQAEFVGPLGTQPAPERVILRRAVDWMRQPLKWGKMAHVVRVEPQKQELRELGLDVVAEFVFGPEGLAITLEGRDGEKAPFEIFGFVLARDTGYLISRPLKLFSEFNAGNAVLLVNSAFEISPPDTPSGRFRFLLGGGIRAARKEDTTRFVVNVNLSDVAANYFAAEALRLVEVDGRHMIDYVGEEQTFRLGSVDPATGVVSLEVSDVYEDARISAHSERGAVRKRLERFRAAQKSEMRAVNPLLFLSKASIAVVGTRKDLAPATRANLMAVDLVLAALLRDDGGLVTALRGAFRADRTETEEHFIVPDPAALRLLLTAKNPVAVPFAKVALLLAPKFPLGSWPRTLLVESACVVSQQTAYTQQEIARVYSSSDIGPIGCWMFSEAAKLAGMLPISRLFAKKGTLLCTPEGFENELRLLEAIAPGLVEDLDAGLQALDRDAVAELVKQAAAVDNPRLARLAQALHEWTGKARTKSSEESSEGAAAKEAKRDRARNMLRTIWKWSSPALRWRLQSLQDLDA